MVRRLITLCASIFIYLLKLISCETVFNCTTNYCYHSNTNQNYYAISINPQYSLCECINTATTPYNVSEIISSSTPCSSATDDVSIPSPSSTFISSLSVTISTFPSSFTICSNTVEIADIPHPEGTIGLTVGGRRIGPLALPFLISFTPSSSSSAFAIFGATGCASFSFKSFTNCLLTPTTLK